MKAAGRCGECGRNSSGRRGLDCLWRSSLRVNDLALKDINVAIDSKKMPPSGTGARRGEESGPLNLPTSAHHAESRVALNNINTAIG